MAGGDFDEFYLSNHGKKERSLHDLHRVNVVVVPASRQVRDVLDRSRLVLSYAPVGGLTTSFSARASADLHALACALQESEGFAGEGARRAIDLGDSLTKALANRARVFRVLKNADLEIFMNPDASESAIAQMRESLVSDDDIQLFRYFSRADAYNEFTRIFAQQPDLITKTKPSDLPPSFRVTLRDPALTQANRFEYEGREAVDSVVTFDTTKSVRIFATSRTGDACTTP
jgi:hypothetical protein